MISGPTFQKGRQHALIRTSNRIGAFLLRHNIRPPLTNLDPEAMIRRAIRSTGLQDFGTGNFREPFHVLVEAAKNEGHLTTSGMRAAHETLVNALKLRLKTQEAVRRFPEILEQPIRRPLIVLGVPRTGTTLMNHLLALDPAARPLLMWEAGDPTPWRFRRAGRGDPRRSLCKMGVWVIKKLYPELAVAHDFGSDVPDECQYLFRPSFIWPPDMVLPSYRAWLKSQPESVYDEAYAIYRRALQMLHWQRPAQDHWVLKSPLHSWALPALMTVVPEASVIQTHRHMREVIPSICSLGAILASMYSDAVDPAKVGPYGMEFVRDAIDRILAHRPMLEPARVYDVTYARFLADPVGTIRSIYDRFGYEFVAEHEARIERFLVEKDPSRRPKHIYSMEQFNLDADAIDEKFADYHRQFGLLK